MAAPRAWPCGWPSSATSPSRIDYYGDGKPLPPQEVGPRFAALAGDAAGHPPAGPGRAIGAAGPAPGATPASAPSGSASAARCASSWHAAGPTSRRSSASTPGSGRPPRGAVNSTAKVLVCIGADDPIDPPEQRVGFQDEMRAATWIGGSTSTAGPCTASPTLADQMGMAAIKYHKPTGQRSWRAMLDLFDEALGP